MRCQTDERTCSYWLVCDNMHMALGMCAALMYTFNIQGLSSQIPVQMRLLILIRISLNCLYL